MAVCERRTNDSNAIGLMFAAVRLCNDMVWSCMAHPPCLLHLQLIICWDSHGPRRKDRFKQRKVQACGNISNDMLMPIVPFDSA